MTRMSLAETLTQLVSALDPADAPAVTIEEASITVPVEVRFAAAGGAVRLEAAPPGTIWTSGFELPVSRLRLTAAASAQGAQGLTEESDGS